MSDLISLRAYARLRRERALPGGSLRAVQKAIAAKRIRLIDGKIDPEVADIQWDRNTDPDQQKRGASGGTPSSLGELETPPREPGHNGSGAVAAGVQTSAPAGNGGSQAHDDQVSRIREAARADAARAELLHLELDLKRGNLVRAEDVRKAAFDKARVARDRLMAIPDRLAPLLAAESDPRKAHALLAEELHRVCAELAAGEDKPTRQ